MAPFARFFTVTALASLAFACTGSGGGPGGGVEAPTESRDPPGAGNGPESPGGGRESPGGGRESPGTGAQSQDPGGASSSSSGSSSGSSGSGGSSSGGHGSCPACDESYDCSVPGVASSDTTVTLSTVNDKCVVTTSVNTVFSCDGTILEGATTIPWSAFGNGGFAFVTGGVSVQCVPSSAATPVSGGTTTGS